MASQTPGLGGIGGLAGAAPSSADAGTKTPGTSESSGATIQTEERPAGLGTETVAESTLDNGVTITAPVNKMPTADDLGVDANRTAGMGDESALDAARQGVNTETEGTTYSCHPIRNLQIGRFKFVDSLLKLEGDAVEEFESLVDGMPLVERNTIHKIDHSAAETMAAAFLRNHQGAMDSSAGRGAMHNLMHRMGVVGETDVGGGSEQ